MMSMKNWVVRYGRWGMIGGLLLAGCGGDSDEGTPAATGGLGGLAGLGGATGSGGGSSNPGGTAESFQADVTDQTPSDGPEVAGGYVYWLRKADVGTAGLGMDRVQRKPVDGGAVEDVAGPASIYDVETDEDNVYWIQSGGQLWARAHDGSEPVQLAELSPAPIRITVGAEHVLTRGDELALVPKEGGDPIATPTAEDLQGATVVADGDQFFVLTRAAGEELGVYEGTITRHDVDGDPEVIATGIESPGRLLGVDGEFLYLSGSGTTSVTPRLLRVDRSGGFPEPLGEEDWGFSEAVLRDGVVYGALFVDDWAVYRYPLDGSPEHLADFEDGLPEGFAVGGDWLYWVHVRDLYRVAIP